MDTDRLIIIKRIATLQEMAAHAMVLHIWQGYVSRSASYKHRKYYPSSYVITLFTTLELSEDCPSHCNELITNLQMPKSIENILTKSFKNIQMEMAKWILSFRDIVFQGSLKKYLHRLSRTDMNNICWTQNLEINYEKTVLKMISLVKLSKIQKFIIYCKYCMVNEITSFPQSSLRWDTVKILREDILLNYWICQLRKEIFTIPRNYLREIENTYIGLNISLDVAMVVHCRNEDKFGFPYFWNCLAADEQVTVAARILKETKGQYQMHVMSNMSALQQRQLVCKIPDVITKNFILWLDTPENAISCWNLTKDIMTEEEFLTLVDWVFVISIGEEKSNRIEECHAFLVHVWDTASDRLRNYGLTEGVYIMDFFSPCHTHTASGLKFMHRYFSLKCPKYRKAVLLDNADKFAVNVPVFDLSATMNFIQLCLPNNDDRLEFEKRVLASDWTRECLKKLLHHGKIRDINMKLEIFTPTDIVGVGELKKRVLELNPNQNFDDYTTKHYISDLGKWKELNEFIDGTFANDVSSALNLKKAIFFALAKKKYFLNHFYRSDEMVKVVEHGLPPNEVEIFKQMLLNNLREMIQSNERSWWPFDKKTLNKHLFWYLGDWEKVREFMNRVPASMLI